MDGKTDTGYLISITDTSTGRSVFLFLYITGQESLKVPKAVIEGIRSLRLPGDLKKKTEIRVDAVADLTRLVRDYPETEGATVPKLPLTAFFDSKKKSFKERLFLAGVKNVIQKEAGFFPDNRHGAVVTGPDFFDREETVKKILNLVGKGRGIMLCGPRRYGKTSLMREIQGLAPQHGFRSIMIDLESVFSPEEFVARLWVEFRFSGDREEKKEREVSRLQDEIRQRWEAEGERLFKEMYATGEKVIFLLDECPYMLDTFLGKEIPGTGQVEENERRGADQFIKWFKKQRELFRKQWVFVLTGSVNPKPYLKDTRLDIQAFSDLQELRLTFFDAETVRIYIESLLLGEGIILPSRIIDELVRLTTPGIPYFIQIVLNHVVRLYKTKPDFSLRDLRDAYEKKIIGPDGRRHFDTFERHLNRYGGRRPVAEKILARLAGAGNKGVEKEKLMRACRTSSGNMKEELNIVLGYLEYDFYIDRVKNTERYRFASPILRDYWKKNRT